MYFLSRNDYLKYYKDAEYIARADGTMFVMSESLFDDAIIKQMVTFHTLRKL